MLLLPLLVTALQMQSPSEAAITHAVADGIRKKLAAGWTLVDQRMPERDELAFTLVKNAKVEVHVAHFDDDAGHSYRIDVVSRPPAEPISPSPFVVRALAGPGGFELSHDCGHLEAHVYLVAAHAQGRAAAHLVADTLKRSMDVEGADLEGDEATFALELVDGQRAQLRVTLDDTSRVLAAELRHYEDAPGDTTYEGQARMQQKIGAAITSIEAGARGVVLRGDKWFEIVPDKFERNFPLEPGCQC